MVKRRCAHQENLFSGFGLTNPFFLIEDRLFFSSSALSTIFRQGLVGDSPRKERKKPTWSNPLWDFDHVGLLFNGLPADGSPFI
jgi:hypothetical protein